MVLWIVRVGFMEYNGQVYASVTVLCRVLICYCHLLLQPSIENMFIVTECEGIAEVQFYGLLWYLGRQFYRKCTFSFMEC